MSEKELDNEASEKGSEKKSDKGSIRTDDCEESDGGSSTRTEVLRCNLFLEDDIRVKEPVHLFHEWYAEARKHKQVLTPNSFCLTTCDKNSVPSARIITLSSFNKQGFQFIGNMASRKGLQLEENPVADLCYFWPHLQRFVRIHGPVEPLPMNVIKADFNRKPLESKITSLLQQGKPVRNRAELENLVEALREKYGENVPMPKEWGGYMLVPRKIEFIQRHKNFLHDRIRFRRQEKDEKDTNLTKIGEDGWVYERLWP